MSEATAQSSGKTEDPREDFIRLDIAYIFGGQVYNDNFLYNPGVSLNSHYGIQFTDRISAGPGIGFQQLRNEKFIPVFFDLTGQVNKKKNTRLISFQLGYSFAWSESLRNLPNCTLNGGVYLNAGFGRNFHLNDKTSLIMNISYRHQFAELVYEVFNLKEYRERINYDMLLVGLGFMF